MPYQCGAPLSPNSVSLIFNASTTGLCVYIVKNLKKFDHVSAHRTELGWLPVDTLIRYRTLCTMHQLYHRTFTLLNPPILFGPQHTYSTRCPPTFRDESILLSFSPIFLSSNSFLIYLLCSIFCSTPTKFAL